MSELGEILRSARLKKGIALDDVADATRIKLAYLEALEDGEYSLLPGPAYVTGFLRTYARYLGLHPEDVVEEFYAAQPVPQPSVRAATRVLANGHHRQHRARILWALSIVVLLLAAGYAIKEYNDTYAHSYAAPLNVTPANLGAPDMSLIHHAAPKIVRLALRPTAPVWVRITVDGKREFQGIMRPRTGEHVWTAHHGIYVFTFEPAHLRVIYNGRHLGLLARNPGPIVEEATPSSLRPVS